MRRRLNCFFFAISLDKGTNARDGKAIAYDMNSVFFLQGMDFPSRISFFHLNYSSTMLVHLPLAPQGSTPPEVTGKTTS